MVQKIENAIVRYARAVIKYRWLAIGLSLAVTIAMGTGAQYLGFSTNYRVFFSKYNPQLESFERMQDIYTKADGILFVLVPDDGDALDADTVKAAAQLTTGGWQIPYATRVDSVNNFQDTRAEGDDLTVGDLIEDENSDLAYAKKKALAEPFLNGQLIRDTANMVGINVTLTFSSDDPREVAKAVKVARALARKVEADNPGHRVRITGLTMLNNAFAESSQNDMMTLIPIMYGVILLFAMITLRSFTAVAGTLLVIMLSTITGMGFAGWVGIKLSPPSAMAPTMIMTLAVADSIHILLSMLVAMRKGMKKDDAIVESLRVNFGPVFLTSLTTAIGFLSMNFSEAPPFWHLGNITAVGVAGAWLYSILFLPALVSILPMRAKKESESTVAAGLGSLAEFVIARRKQLLVGVSAVAIGLSLFIPRNEFDDRWVEYFDETMAFRTDSDFTADNLTGLYQMQFNLKSGEEGGIQNPAYLQNVQKFQQWLESRPQVVHVVSFTDVMKKVNRSMHGDDEAYYKLPESRNLAAQYLLLYEMSLPYGFDLNNQINIDKSATRLTATIRDMSTRETREFAAETEAWLRANTPTSMHATASSAAVMFAHISIRNLVGALTGAFLALILISGILMLTLRSLRVGTISLVPNLLPALAGFGVWGILGGRVTMSLALVTGMTIGIVVDDTVHFLAKYLRARREQGMNPQDAIRYVFQTVGPALVGTTVVLVAGFIVLAQSHFEMNSSMGKLTAITIVIALAADLLLLPPLLMMFEEIWAKKDKKKEQRHMTKGYRKLVDSIATGALLLVLGTSSVYAETAEEKGLAIAIEADRRDIGFSDFSADSLMILKNKRGHTSTRHTRVRTLEVIDGGDKTLVLFDKPRDVKDTKFLTHSKMTGNDDQWLFLPALKRVKRISANNKSGPFMGSEFSYEDISSQEVEEYTYKWLRDEGNNFVIERYPVDKKSGYTKLVTWLDKEHYRLQKVQFHDRKGDLLKTLDYKDYHQYLGKHWRPNLMTVVNHQTGKSTDLQWSNYQFKKGLTARDFDRNALKRTR
ncbi:MAG: RND transporter [Elusimicrobia bacterium]|nr:MAG: RND transporter [Elusimicrobiota bacterium]